jgi:hypothetical protein
MGEGKLTQRQRRAYSYAAIATAIYISKMIPIGQSISPITTIDRKNLSNSARCSISTKAAGLLAPRQLP